jgi:hypothetical protein
VETGVHEDLAEIGWSAEVDNVFLRKLWVMWSEEGLSFSFIMSLGFHGFYIVNYL